MDLKEGDKVRINVIGKYEGHFWSECKILYLSACGRYARIKGNIAWGKKSREITVPTNILKT